MEWTHLAWFLGHWIIHSIFIQTQDLRQTVPDLSFFCILFGLTLVVQMDGWMDPRMMAWMCLIRIYNRHSSKDVFPCTQKKYQSIWQIKCIIYIRVYTPRNLTWKLKIMVSKWTFLFQGLIFRFHVKFRGCIHKYKSIKTLDDVRTSGFGVENRFRYYFHQLSIKCWKIPYHSEAVNNSNLEHMTSEMTSFVHPVTRFFKWQSLFLDFECLYF